MRIFVTVAALAVLAGCATPRDRALTTDAITPPPAFVTEYRLPAGTDGPWWRGFEDPQLDSAVQRALTDNLTIAAARDRMAAARAAVRAERSDLFPSVSADAGVEASGLVSDRLETDPVGGLGVLFNIDLNGRLSREIEVAAARARASAYLLSDARRLVAAATVQQYVELRRAEARLALIEESTELQQRTLRIVELRYGAGLSANLDVRRAAADLAQTEAQRGVLALQRAQAARALSVLMGETPQPLPQAPADPALPAFAGGPPTGVPADLLRRRPDLLVAEANLAEAAALVGVERADLFPALALSGRISVGDSFGAGLIDRLLGSVAAILDVTLLDGGRRRAEIRAARAEADTRFDDYHQTLLDALREVENALVAIESYSDRSAKLRDAIEQSESAFSQSNALYREGLTSLFDVLDAQRQLIASRQSLIDSDAQIAFAIVDLYAAVGASWDQNEAAGVGVEGSQPQPPG